ncbi:DUF1002 domain-containing protein [Hydrogenibacillus schlegelii]|uniref:DUF1002 domain-containing protein n=1 Tax=Hydrogenibacillus schlegelii TaxID=1484 RepID=UPI000AEEB40D|nr:DUF1002 domain-containing protein [Hydrogenibacillus schlegelii]
MDRRFRRHPVPGARAPVRRMAALLLFFFVFVFVWGWALGPGALDFGAGSARAEEGRPSDGGRERPVVVLGADLAPADRQAVLERLGAGPDDRRLTVTNAEERALLAGRFPPSVIGTRAISSVRVVPREAGAGLSLELINITGVAPEIYRQALLTAGVRDASVRIVAPYPVSGTAALVGLFKAYEAAEGAGLSPERKAAALDEFAVAERLGEHHDPKQVAALLGALKEALAVGGLRTPAEIEAAVKQEAARLGLELTESDLAAVRDLVERLRAVNIDWERLKAELRAVTEATRAWLDEPATQSLLAKVGSFLKSLWQALVGLWDRWLNAPPAS